MGLHFGAKDRDVDNRKAKYYALGRAIKGMELLALSLLG